MSSKEISMNYEVELNGVSADRLLFWSQVNRLKRLLREAREADPSRCQMGKQWHDQVGKALNSL